MAPAAVLSGPGWGFEHPVEVNDVVVSMKARTALDIRTLQHFIVSYL